MSQPNQNPKTPLVTAAYDVPTPGKRELFSVNWHRVLTKRVNALLHTLSVGASSNGPLIVADANCALPVAGGQSQGTGTGGGVNPRGAYSSSVDYNVNDLVYVDVDAKTRVPYICEIQNGPTHGVQAPSFPPDPGTVYWRCYSYFGGQGLRNFKILSLHGTYLTCSEWNGSSYTGSWTVYKPYHLRTDVSSEVIDGVTVNYTYDVSDPDNKRVADDGTNVETEVMHPRYVAGDFVEAQMDVDTNTLIELKKNRNWARKYVQP